MASAYSLGLVDHQEDSEPSPWPFTAYAEEWNNYPSERVAEQRHRKGWERGQRWARGNSDALTMTPEQVIDHARCYRWSPDYAEGIYAALRANIPVE